MKLQINAIQQNENSRVVVRDTDLTQLMQSMKVHGQLQPIGVRSIKKGEWEVIFGNRRLLAAQKLGWKEIEVKDLTADRQENDLLFINLAENLARRDLSAYEEGRYYDVLEKAGLNKAEIATRVGVHSNRISTSLDVYRKTPPKFRSAVRYGASRRTKNGEVPASIAQAIVQTHGLTKWQIKKLFVLAKRDGMTRDHIHRVAELVRGGMDFKQAIMNVDNYKNVSVRLFLPIADIKRIEARTGMSASAAIRTFIAGKNLPREISVTPQRAS